MSTTTPDAPRVELTADEQEALLDELRREAAGIGETIEGFARPERPTSFDDLEKAVRQAQTLIEALRAAKAGQLAVTSEIHATVARVRAEVLECLEDERFSLSQVDADPAGYCWTHETIDQVKRSMRQSIDADAARVNALDGILAKAA